LHTPPSNQTLQPASMFNVVASVFFSNLAGITGWE